MAVSLFIKKKKKSKIRLQYGKAYIINSNPHFLGIRDINYLIRTLSESIFYLHRAATLFSKATAITDGNYHDTMNKADISVA